jgi:phage terminase Nu1 subunit (DNA packaging protein)
MADEIISIAAAAKAIGVNRSTLSRQIASGAIRSHPGGVKLAEVIEDRKRHVDERSGPKPERARSSGASKAGGALTAERTRLAAAQADSAEIKNAALRRELVKATEVEAEWADILRTVKGQMLALPARLRQRLPQLSGSDVSVVDRLIRDILREAGNGKQD